MKKNLILYALLILILLSGCEGTSTPKLYPGDYSDLYTVAINTMLDSWGAVGGWYSIRINIIEQDAYGRVLFQYYESKVNHCLIISQLTEEQFVYFYPDYNFISSSEDNFSMEQINELKERNDWNMDLNIDKCIRKEITILKEEGNIIKDSKFEAFYYDLYDDEPSFISANYFSKDDYGRSIYTTRSRGKRTVTYSGDDIIIMMFYPDGTYNKEVGYFELTELYNYQDELKQFKERNNWNLPFE
ncbi:MAG: hypothetical protein FWC09_03565 [Lachnospiraceae bacterium]|nr:hypothetical protein [Lachnospiraceae bacterium]